MKMRTIFIYMLLDDLKIKICNDALSYIHRNDDYVRESTLDDYLEKIYKEQYSRKMSYTILIAKLKIRSTTAATIASVVGVISFFINITSGNNKIKYIFCFIGAFILGVLLSDPAKNLVKRLLKEE